MNHGPGPRVVVTGIGAVSAWGWGVDTFWNGLCSGRTAIGDFSRFEHDDYPTHTAAQVPDPSPALTEGFATWSRLSLSEKFALAATAEAVTQAGLPDDLGDHDCGTYFSSSTGGMLESEEFYYRLRGVDEEKAKIGLVASQQLSVPGETVARQFKIEGPVQTVSSACASGTLALGLALDAIRCGDVRIAVAGGADCLCRTTFGGFNALRSVDEGPCRPFCKGRAGLSLGEGGAALILETLDSAAARGATPLAEVLGVGAATDAYHMTAPEPTGEGASLAARNALADARLPAESIDFVNAHGTGTPLNDSAEWQALCRVFGARAAGLPVAATKGSVGHLLGTAGVVEAVATVLCLQHRVVHPTPGNDETDPDTPVNLVRNRPHDMPQMKRALSVNLGFGGCNGALVLACWEGA